MDFHSALRSLVLSTVINNPPNYKETPLCSSVELLSVEVDARALMPAALASVPFGFVLVRVRVEVDRAFCYRDGHLLSSKGSSNRCTAISLRSVELEDHHRNRAGDTE